MDLETYIRNRIKQLDSIIASLKEANATQIIIDYAIVEQHSLKHILYGYAMHKGKGKGN